MRTVKIIVFLLAGLVNGCAFTPHPPVVIKPEILATHSDIGAGRTIRVEVTDERPSKSLGTRAVGGRGAEITLAGEFADTVRNTVSQGLTDQGFSISNSLPSDGRQIKVEIRDLQYKLIMGFWAGTMRTECSIKAVCVVGNTRPFEKLYHGDREESVQVVQTAAENVEYINDAVSKTLNQLIGDPELTHCLASPP